MGSEVIILPVIFGVIFGMFYLYISARNRERLALIEKGADATIFYSGKRSVTPVWTVIVLNLALLCMGIGLGIFISSIIESTTNLDADMVYPGIIFFMAGAGLLVGYYITKKLSQEA